MTSPSTPRQCSCRQRDWPVREGGGRYIDDVCFGTVRDMMTANNVEILAHLEHDTALLPQIFRLCRQANPPRPPPPQDPPAGPRPGKGCVR